MTSDDKNNDRELVPLGFLPNYPGKPLAEDRKPEPVSLGFGSEEDRVETPSVPDRVYTPDEGSGFAYAYRDEATYAMICDARGNVLYVARYCPRGKRLWGLPNECRKKGRICSNNIRSFFFLSEFTTPLGRGGGRSWGSWGRRSCPRDPSARGYRGIRGSSG